VRKATADLVAKAELAAVKAQLDREREFRRIADRALVDAARRAEAAEQARNDALADLEARIASDTGEDGAEWTEGDLQWLGR
jgi:hypothetical protein